MALIKCPECGKQISDKAEICPHCGIEVQKILEEIREKKRLLQLLQKKRRRRILIPVVSVCVVAAVAVLVYLYSIDALNTIPADYRKQTEGYFESCESAISNGNFEKGNGCINALKNRKLTKRQAIRLEEKKKAMAELGLSNLENMLDSTENNSDTQIDDEVMKTWKEQMAILNAYQLDTFQTERLYLVKDRYIELRLAEIEKKAVLYSANIWITQIAKDLQGMDMSEEQRIRLEKARNKANRRF